MNLEAFVEKLFVSAKNIGFEECEIYYVDRENLSIGAYKEEVEKYSLTNSAGVSFRGKIGDKIGYSYSEIMDEEAIDMLVTKAKENLEAIESEDVQFIYGGDKEYKKINTYYEALDNLDASKLIDIALKMEKEAYNSDSKVVNTGGCGVSYSSGKYGIINSKGLKLENKSNLLTAYVVPIVKDGDNMHDGFGYVTAKALDEVDANKIANKGVSEALAKIGAKSVPSGNYPVVIDNEAMVSLISTFVGIFSADAAQKGLSLLKDKEGEIVGSSKLSIIDNPHLENGLASVGFDDEGVATKSKYIIREGKLETLLHNLKTANKAEIKSTGNGFKSSYASPVSVSPTNFYIEPGTESFDEILGGIENGVIINDFAGLHSGANSITGDFSLAAKGFYIENGKKTFPVEQITVAGNFFDLLKDVEKVASDLLFPMSSIGSPSIKIKSLSIAGK